MSTRPRSRTQQQGSGAFFAISLIPLGLLVGLGIWALGRDARLGKEETLQQLETITGYIHEGFERRIEHALIDAYLMARNNLDAPQELRDGPILVSSSRDPTTGKRYDERHHYFVTEIADWIETTPLPYFKNSLEDINRLSRLVPQTFDRLLEPSTARLNTSDSANEAEPSELKSIQGEPNPGIEAFRQGLEFARNGDFTNAIESLSNVARLPNGSTETGLPLHPLAAYQIARVRAKIGHEADFRDSLQSALSQILAFPCPLTPKLLDSLDELENQVLGPSAPLVDRAQREWEHRLAEIDFAKTIAPHLGDAGSRFWVPWRGVDWLVFSELAGFSTPIALPKLLVQEAVVDALQATPFAPPHYAGVEVYITGKRVIEFHYSADLQAFYSTRDGRVHSRLEYPKSPQEYPTDPNARVTMSGAPEGYQLEDLWLGRPILERSVSEKSPHETALAIAPSNLSSGIRPPYQLRLILRDKGAFEKEISRRLVWLSGILLGAIGVAGSGVFISWRAYARQIRLNALKSDFVSSVSHELRAPIASIRLMAEGLERGRVDDPEKRATYHRYIHQESRRLSALVENVLDYARIESNRRRYRFERTPIVDLCKETLGAMTPLAREKEAPLEFDEPSALSEAALNPRIDANAIQQALVNLLDNAIKHTEPKTSVRLEIDTDASERFLRLRVRDHGPGVPKNERKRVFERFYRSESEWTRETQGVGIGLSITLHIARGHGGDVSIEDSPGRGATFVLTIPLAPNASNSPSTHHESK